MLTGLSSLSLERKLPLLISVLLVSLASGLTAAGYHEVRQAAELRGIERMQRMTSQLAELSGNSVSQRFATLRTVAADSAVVAYLGDAEQNESERARAVAALRRLASLPGDTPVVAELRSVHELAPVATQP